LSKKEGFVFQNSQSPLALSLKKINWGWLGASFPFYAFWASKSFTSIFHLTSLILFIKRENEKDWLGLSILICSFLVLTIKLQFSQSALIFIKRK